MLARTIFQWTVFACLALLFTACQQQQQYSAPSQTPAYHFKAGRTAILLRNGKAIAPRNAPLSVKRAIAAANSLVGKPYRMGGGHKKHHDSGYDCSGSTSFVLREAGLLDKVRPSGGFLNYGSPGPGDWVSVYMKNGHVFLYIAGLRFDTTGSGSGVGPRWYATGRTGRGFYVRHPRGF